MKTFQKGFVSPLLLALIAVLVIGGGAYAYVQKKSANPPVTATSTAQTANSQTVGPLTITPLIPIVEADQPGASYSSSFTQIGYKQLEAIKDIKKLNDSILKLDSGITSRKIDNPGYVFSVLYANSDESLVLYMMTPTGTYCTTSGEMGSGCDNANLKILNTKNGSISVLTNNFGNGQGSIYLDEKDNSLVIFTGSNYQVFSLNAPYSLRESTPSGFSSLLINEYAISYNQKTSDFVIENILNNKKISCAITNTGVKTALKDNFDFSHFSLSPDGNKIILLEGNTKFFWDDLSNQWSSASSDCLNSAKEAKISGTGSVLRMGKWYANASYFAYSGYGDDTFVYDFSAQKQAFFMPWANTISVGYLNNSGYHDTASVDENISKVLVVPGEKQISVYFEMSDGKRYLVGSYSDKSSTQAFYQLLQQYPVNSAGGYTSGKFANTGVPNTWVRIGKDNTQKNLYHLLVLDGYDIHQVLDISITSTTVLSQ